VATAIDFFINLMTRRIPTPQGNYFQINTWESFFLLMKYIFLWNNFNIFINIDYSELKMPSFQLIIITFTGVTVQQLISLLRKD